MTISADAAPGSAAATASAVPASATATRLRGNAAANPARKRLTVDQVAINSGLTVNEVLGLESDDANPAKHSEQCTWFRESKEIQASLVAQYTFFTAPPSEITTYYKQLV